MPDKAKTSFIPKQPGSGSPRSRKVAQLSIVNFVGMVVFLCGLILAVGTFIYKDLSLQDLEAQKRFLAEERSSFSTSDIESIRALDRRISVASALLDTHLSPSIVFDMLEQRTLESVSYRLFSYMKRPSGSVEVVLDGLTGQFSSLALQERELARAATFSNTTLADLAITEEGLVSFLVVGEADEEMLAFTAPVTIPPVATTTATTTVSAEAGTAATSTPETTESNEQEFTATTTPEATQ